MLEALYLDAILFSLMRWFMTNDEMQTYIVAAAAALELPIAPEHLPGVLLNFERLAGVAAAVNDFALGPADEPGPVWRP